MRLLLILLILAASAPLAEAVAIGVSRADLEFEDVLRNGYAQQTFVVSTDARQPITGALEVEGDIKGWLRFIPEDANESFTFSAQSPQQVTVVVEPPVDAANGEYEGMIRVITGEIARDSDGRFGTSTRAAFRIDTLVGVTDVEQRSCVIGGVKLQTTEIGQPIDAVYSVSNNGNVRVQPELDVEILGRDQEEVVAERTIGTAEEVLPTTSQRFTSQLENGLSTGQYWARVSSDECEGGGKVTFDVLERGGVADEGEFVRIDMESFVDVGDIVPITAVFRNTGERTVSAKFKGTVMRGQEVVKVIDTDFYDTPPDATADIETFFDPQRPGRYEVAGRVLYNNKLTFERVAILNVSGEAQRTLPYGAIILGAIILLLLLLIRKKKRRRG